VFSDSVGYEKEFFEEVEVETEESKVPDSWGEVEFQSEVSFPIDHSLLSMIRLRDLRDETWRRCDDWQPDTRFTSFSIIDTRKCFCDVLLPGCDVG
jgi:hypothetical protein